MLAVVRDNLTSQVRSLFYHGYDNYMIHAFPEDELKPISCTGSGKDRTNHGNLGVNDVCGDYAMTLIDTLDTLCILDDQSGFEHAVRNVIDVVSFDVDSNVQVFEVTIRVLGGLLSAHQYATLPELNSTIPWYQGELLELAHDLGMRLLPAFASPTGIPYPRINLKYGMDGLFPGATTETCSAGAGSLILEFALLSRLSNDSRFQAVADRAFRAIWDRRMELGLVGNTIDANSGLWISSYSSVGAGIDSFYEYALKAWVFLGENYFYDVWNHSRSAITTHILDEEGIMLRNIHLRTGFQLTNYIDSLSAYYPGLLVLAGDLKQATKIHLIYQSLWTRYRALPERYNFNSQQAEIPWYPLRPEFIESTYFLYRATRDPFYLAIGQQIVEDLTKLKQQCGFAALASVTTRRLDDRMESFMLSETLKYLYLLFEENHPLNHLGSNWVFTTEGHPIFAQDHHKSANVTRLSFAGDDRCEVPADPSFFSAAMSHGDLSYVQLKAGLALNNTLLPDYFPAGDPRGMSTAIRRRTDIEVLFGAVASTVANASANFVQIGRDLVIKSLLGLKIRFQRENATWKATRVGDSIVSEDAEVLIEDPLFERYITQDLVNFTGNSYDTRLEAIAHDDSVRRIDGIAGQYGSLLPSTPHSMNVVSMLTTSNADGCICPAILHKKDQEISPEKTALILYRGGCSFYDKSSNAQGQARLLLIVDQAQDGPSFVRPTLVDANGEPMDADENYPSVVFVEGFNYSAILHNAQSLVLTEVKTDAHKVKLILRGEEVQNIEVSVK